MSHTIVKGKAALVTSVAKALASYTEAGVLVHVAAVSTIFHAAKHGDCELLNRLHNGLRPNDQAALKLYVRRAHILLGLIEAKAIKPNEGIPSGDDALPSEVIQSAHELGQVLDFKSKEYVIAEVDGEKRGHTSKQAKALAAICEKRFINPDGVIDLPVLTRDNVTEVKTLGDAEALKALLRAVKSIEANSKTRQVSVSDRVAKMFARIKNEAETMANVLSQQSSLDTTPKPAPAQRKAARPRKAAAPAVVH